MTITAIKQQLKRAGRYSIFVDGKYAFSLSDTALLETGLVNDQELTEQQVKDYKRLSDDDKLYAQVLGLLARRLRSRWEIEFYLQRKQVSPPLINIILNKLSNVGLLDDEKFARAYVNDRRLLRPASRRKMTLELRQKHLSDEIIQRVLGVDEQAETAALRSIIDQKRRQTRYQDNQKLMQYLARQGFSYQDIKSALEDTTS